MRREGNDPQKRQAALLGSWLLVLATLAYLVFRGVWHPAWFATPLMVLLSTCLFGPRTGVSQAALAIIALITTAVLQANGTLTPQPAGPVLWAVVGSMVLLGIALCGVLLHQTLASAIEAEDNQNKRIVTTMRALRHRERVLRHAMRVETAGEVSSMVAHQLRNQFQLILGQATVGKDSADPREQFDTICDQVKASNQILENLLGMVRLDNEKPERVDLGTAVREMGERFRQLLPASIQLAVQAPSSPLPVSVDPVGLEHALLNLVVNARQAMPQGGTLRLEAVQGPEQATLVIQDTGPGMSAEVREQVFEPFFTTKPKGKGTGLGLAAVRRFVVGAGGEIDLQSAPGEGARFSLRFPLATPVAEEDEPTLLEPPPASSEAG